MQKGQSKLRSFWEANTNTAIGLVIQLIAAPLVYKLVGMKWVLWQLGASTFIFTIISVIRGYLIRRFFNKREKEKELLMSETIKDLTDDKNKYYTLAKIHYDASLKWKDLYVNSRSDRASLNQQIYELNDKLANLQDEYDYTIQVGRSYIRDIENKAIDPNTLAGKVINILQADIIKLTEELDMCKHLNLAAVSDLVEGADYQVGEPINLKDHIK